MDWDNAGFNSRLAAAVSAYDRLRVGELLDELLAYLPSTDEPYPIDDARRVLDLLRRKRYFVELERTAAGFVHAGQDAPVIRRLYSQALIEAGHLEMATTILESVAGDTAPGSKENLEARGLLGRAHKQAYLDGGTSSTERSRVELRSAAELYQGVYREDPTDPARFWHGINAVAVLMRAQADGVEIPGFADPADQAREIRDAIELRRQDQIATMWDYGAAAEVCVALNLGDEAVTWMASYTQAPNGDAFEYSSTLRQLEELWRLTPDVDPGERLLPLLRAAVLRHEGGRLDLDAQRAQLGSLSRLTRDGAYESVLGNEAFEGVRWLQTALERAASVALVTDPMGNAVGTAFVVRTGDCCPALGDEDDLLLVTNAHVIGEDPDVAAVLPPDARITFESEPDVTYEVARVVWTSPLAELDTSIVRTDPPITGHAPMPIAAALPRLDARVYIIGHPQGRPLSYSIYDNRLLNTPEPLLHYRTPTEGGSSGSPVFNRNWQLVGLHHKGSLSVEIPGVEELQAANEGIMFEAIAARVSRPRTEQGG
jgi:V8-like Glu-specific endopeptidase